MFFFNDILKEVSLQLCYADCPYWHTFLGSDRRGRVHGPIPPKECNYGYQVTISMLLSITITRIMAYHTSLCKLTDE